VWLACEAGLRAEPTQTKRGLTALGLGRLLCVAYA